MLRTLLALIFTAGIFGFASDVHANSGKRIQKFVQIKQDRELFVDWMPAKAGFQTVVVLNGLTYSTKQWDRFANSLHKMGYGLVRYDMIGMGQTLVKYAPVFRKIELADQVTDLKALISQLGLSRVNLLGLSYGGGVAIAFAAQNPSMVDKLILMAPFTQPVEGQDQWIKGQIWATRQLQPWNTSSDDELYDFFLKQIVYTTYPAAEPSVLENPFKLEAVFRLVQGIRKWSFVEAARSLPTNSVHMIIAGEDQYIPLETLEKFWNEIPSSSRASLMIINDSEHKIPEDVPHYSASWVAEILKGNPDLSGGRAYNGDSYTGVVNGPNGQQIKLPRELDGRK